MPEPPPQQQSGVSTGLDTGPRTSNLGSKKFADLKEDFYSLHPSNLEAERALLACLVADPGLHVDLTVDQFLDRDHQLIYSHILHMKVEGEPLSFQNLLGRLARAKAPIFQEDLDQIMTRIEVMLMQLVKDPAPLRVVAVRCARQIAETSRHRHFSRLILDAPKLEPGQLPPPFPLPIPIQPLCEFNREAVTERFLVPGVLLAGQPGVISGPFGSLKTALTLDLLISVATGSDFLGHFPVAEPGPVLFITDGTMKHAVQDLTRRICAGHGVNPDTLNTFCISTELPDLTNIDHLERLRDLIVRHQLKVVAIDPGCIGLGGTGGWSRPPVRRRTEDDVAPGMVSNPLESLARVSRSTGCNVLFVHRSTGSRQVRSTSSNRHADSHRFPLMPNAQCLVPNLSEFAAQWIQLSRRAGLDPQTGNHELWMNCGNLSREFSTWGVDVSEGAAGNPLGRHWLTNVLSPDEARARAEEGGWIALDDRRERKILALLDRDRLRLVNLLRTYPEGEISTALRGLLGFSGGRMGRVLKSLLELGAVTESPTIGRRGALIYKLTPAALAELEQEPSTKPHDSHRGALPAPIKESNSPEPAVAHRLRAVVAKSQVETHQPAQPSQPPNGHNGTTFPRARPPLRVSRSVLDSS